MDRKDLFRTYTVRRTVEYKEMGAKMKKILVRGGADPLKHYTPGKLLRKDSLGSNLGNSEESI